MKRKTIGVGVCIHCNKGGKSLYRGHGCLECMTPIWERNAKALVSPESEVRVPTRWITLNNVHNRNTCAGRPCTIHHQTDHRMRDWDLHWRNDRGIFERICAHGVGHPDPDQFYYWEKTGRMSEAVHGCDGCCQTIEVNDAD